MAQTDNFRKYKSLFSTTLSSSISTGTGETITLNSVTGLPTDTEITITIDRVDSNGTATPSAMERITGTISGSNLTSYTRGVDGSTEQAHSSGAVVEMIWNADDLNDMVDGILTEHNQDGSHSDITASTIAASTVTASAITLGAVVVPSISSTNTFTNKRITPRETTEASSATPTINTNNTDIHTITALADNITSFTTNLSGTPTDGQKLIIRIQCGGTGKTIAWGASFESAGATLPTTITANKKAYVGLMYNADDSKWDCVAAIEEA